VPLDLTSGRRQKLRDSGNNHFEITKETTVFCPSGFTAQSTSMRMPEMIASRVSRFPTAVQRERRLWERDWFTNVLRRNRKNRIIIYTTEIL